MAEAFPLAWPAGWPTSREVLAELRRRNPEAYAGVRNFSYSPGSGPGLTAAQAADLVEAALAGLLQGEGE